ncbi:DUF1376 domain-containing protein [Bartonella sp. B12(2025)]
MSSKLPWTRLNAGEWMNEVSCLSPAEKCIYVMLRFQMLYTGEPLFNDAKALALYVGYSTKTFIKVLELLLLKKKIIRLEDGRLWNLDVEAELINVNENVNKFSERASKAACVRWKKNKEKLTNNACDAKHDAYGMLNDAKHDACDAKYVGEQKEKKIPPHTPLKENKNINKNKKTNTIVLSKKEKEIGSENSETIDLVDELTEVDVLERQPEQIAVVAETQPSLHEPENIPKKAERSKAKRGCRLPEDFEPDYAFAIAEGLSPECVKVEIAKFRDYWRSKSGANATKTDWPATWRNWIRNSKSYGNSKIGGNYGNNSQRQKSIGERIADCVLDIGNRGYFEANSRNDSSGISLDFENWQCVNETARNDGIRSF